MLDILVRHFKVPPVRLRWRKRISSRLLGFYHSRAVAIHIFPNTIRENTSNTIESVLCHEFSHHLCTSKLHACLREDSEQHDFIWFSFLVDVVEFWYHSPRKYPWPIYPATKDVVSYILKRRRRPPTHSLQLKLF